MAFFSRGKNRIKEPYNLSDIYPKYIEEKGEQKAYNVAQKDFVTICDKFYEEIRDGILDGKTFKMPFGLGEILITKRKITHYKTNDKSVDWATTLKIGKKVYHLNEHSNGYNYGIDWDNYTGLRNFKSYRFYPTRTFKRTLAQLIKNKEQDYYERENYKQ